MGETWLPPARLPFLPVPSGAVAMAALSMVMPPHLGSSCLRCRGDPRNCSCRLCLKSQEGDARQMLVGAFPATWCHETPTLSPSKGHCDDDQ